MAAYLKFHQLESSPFEGPASDRLVLATESLRRAYAQIKSGLEEDAPRVCLSGGRGIGKSSLARALPKLLREEARAVLIRDPSVSWDVLRETIARQLELAAGTLSRSALIQARAAGRRLVLVIDQAEQLSRESLEHLDALLGYRGDDGEQLLQCVLLSNLESAPRGEDVPLLWWLDELTTRQLRFSPIPDAGMRHYVDKHLEKAGWRGGRLFTDPALVAIHRYTGGVPGAVGALCERLLARAADERLTEVDEDLVARVCEHGHAPESSREDLFGELPRRGRPLKARMSEEPPPKGAPHAADDRHELGSRAPTLSRRAAPTRAKAESESEPELEIQQGLVPMDDSLADRMRDPSFDDYFAPRVPRPERPRGPRIPYPTTPEEGGLARLLRRVTVIGLLAALAALATHLWRAEKPVILDELREIPALPKPKLPNVRMPELPKLGELENELSRAVEGSEEPASGKPHDRTIDEPELAVETQGEGGLTSDLRLTPRNAAAAPGTGAEAPETREGAAPGAVMSADELHDLAREAAPSDDGYQPWTGEQPETTGSRPSAPRSAPAAPAPARP